jgi:hypothetical protein
MTGNKKTIHFLSASDRVNYGDLLFPLIIEWITKDKDLHIHYYGIIKSDLTHFGGKPTNSYRLFQKRIKENGGNIIIGGGEVLFVDWGSLYAFINRYYSKILFNKSFSAFEKKFNLTRFLLSDGKVSVPFAPHKDELNTKKKVKIFYNAVGGTFLNSRLENHTIQFKKSLKSADFISVRDKRAKASLKLYDVNSILSPDSAIIISDIIKREEISKKTSFSNDVFKQDYIFLQIGKPYAPIDYFQFSETVLNISRELNCNIILCPIGLAPRHEDDFFLKKLSRLSDRYQFIMPKSIFDILYLIANSKYFLGTSLHGIITAQSYGVPFIPLNKQIEKVEEYCKTWTYKNIDVCLDYNELEKSIQIFEKWNYQSAIEDVIMQKKLVHQNFDRILGSLI